MPDISKLSGALIDSVGKVDGVLKGDIASIVGLTVPSSGAYTPPLDTYTGATAAYSVRKLSSSYSGSCIEAYRVSDGATQNIGFDSAGLIDTAAIISFAGGGEVRVQTWYDQSGNGNNATNATPAGQPQIYDGSSVITTNGKPSLLHASDNNWLSRQTNITGTVTNFYVFIASDTNYSLHGGGTNLLATSGSSSSAGTTTGLYINSVQFTGSTRDDLYTAFGTSQVLSSDNVRVGDPLEGLVIFGYKATAASGFNFNDGNVQEVITWNSDQTSIRTGLEANLNSYFQVTNLPDYTSGLLYDYPGAAAAYSVRSLSNTAIKCMRVRRTVSPFDEQDIGFDSNGDLDTAAIASFGGSDPLTVSAWYDQSGQSRHATQATAGSQPQIYNGTAVITENGKPALDFDGTDDLMDSPTMTVTDGEFMQTAVYTNDVNLSNSAVATCDSFPVRVAQTIQFPNTTNVRLLTFNSSGGIDEIISATTTSAGTQTLATAHVLNGQGEVFVNGAGAFNWNC